MKHCETFEHTADVGLSARADTLGELLEALAEGLADLICPRENVEAREKKDLRVEAEDVEAMTVDFLSDVLSLMEADRFAVAACRVGWAHETAVAAEFRGEPLDPDRHEIGTEVKAVTYHGLQVARDGDAWTARVLLDI